MNRITSRVMRTTCGRCRPCPTSAATLGRAVSGDQIVDTNSGQIYVQIKPSADYDRAYSAIRGIVRRGARHAGDRSRRTRATSKPACSRRRDKTYGAGLRRETTSELHALATQIGDLMSRAQRDRSAADLGADDRAERQRRDRRHEGPRRRRAARRCPAPGLDARLGPHGRQLLRAAGGVRRGRVEHPVGPRKPAGRPQPADRHHRTADTCRCRASPTSASARTRSTSSTRRLSRYVDVTAPVYVGSRRGRRSRRCSTSSRRSRFPLDYHAEIVGGTPEDPTSHLKFLSFGLAALVGILLLLQAAFGSWRLACMFLLALPASVIGGLLVALAIGQVAARSARTPACSRCSSSPSARGCSRSHGSAASRLGTVVS